jgi:hypothetical protein
MASGYAHAPHRFPAMVEGPFMKGSDQPGHALGPGWLYTGLSNCLLRVHFVRDRGSAEQRAP